MPDQTDKQPSPDPPLFTQPAPPIPGDDPTPDDRLVAMIGDHRQGEEIRKLTEYFKLYETAKERARAEIEAEKYAADLEALDARSRDLTAFIDEAPPGLRYDVGELLPAEGNFTLVAAKKTGKTSTVIELIRAYADGSPFLGRFPITGGPQNVSLCDYEMGDDQLREWMRRAGIQNTDRVHILPLRGHHLSLRTPGAREWVVQWLRDREIGLWILDPAHRAATGFTTKGDPNDPVQEFTETLEQIKRAAGVRNIGLPIHTGHSGDDARGASRWGDWPDAIWKLTKDKNGRRTLSAEGRDVDLAETPVHRDPETRRLTVSAFDTASGSTYQGPSVAERVLGWLRDNPDDHPTQRRMAGLLGVRRESVADAVEELEQARPPRIVVRRGPRNSHPLWLPEHVTAEESAQREAAQPRQAELDE
ncbi:AAA family ATPase [Streptomyces sp. NPDC004959]|uniref:AAA family ATPase n=1 Tax=Streptomyces sp. NPDC004959 TaxID=3154673 RepID=UPI00339E51AF